MSTKILRSPLGEHRLALYALLYENPIANYAYIDPDNGKLTEHILLIGDDDLAMDAFKVVFSAAQSTEDTKVIITVLTQQPEEWKKSLSSRRYRALKSFAIDKGYADVQFVKDVHDVPFGKVSYVLNYSAMSPVFVDCFQKIENRINPRWFCYMRADRLSDDYHSDEIVRIAANINYAYEKKYNQRASVKKCYDMFDERLDKEFQKRSFYGGDYNADSSLSCAAHIGVKLSLCKQFSPESDPLDTLNTAIKTKNSLYYKLVASEHRRWNAYMVTRGFYSDPELEEKFCFTVNQQGEFRNQRVAEKKLHMCMCDCHETRSVLAERFEELYKIYITNPEELKDLSLSELDMASLRAHYLACVHAEEVKSDVAKIQDSITDRDLKSSVQKLIDDNPNSEVLYERSFNRAKETAQNAEELKRHDCYMRLFKSRNGRMSFITLDEQMVSFLPFVLWFRKKYKTAVTITERRNPIHDVLLSTVFCAEDAIFITDDPEDNQYDKRVCAYFAQRGGNTKAEFVKADLQDVEQIADILRDVSLRRHAADDLIINCVPTLNSHILLAIGQLTAGTKGMLQVMFADKTGLTSYCGDQEFAGLTDDISLSVAEILRLIDADYSNEYDPLLLNETERESLRLLFENALGSTNDGLAALHSFLKQTMKQKKTNLTEDAVSPKADVHISYRNGEMIIQPLRFSVPEESRYFGIHEVLQKMNALGLVEQKEGAFCFKSASVLRVFKQDGTSFEYIVFGLMWASGLFGDVQTGVKICTDNVTSLLEESEESSDEETVITAGQTESSRRNAGLVNNEVDVIAVSGTVPVFVSCKDKDKVTKADLYEIHSLSSRYGAVPVLACAGNLLSQMRDQENGLAILARAKHLGVSFLGSETLFLESRRKKAFSMIAAGKTYSILDKLDERE